MLLVLPELLDAKALKTVDGILSKSTFVEGETTAGEEAKLVKRNLQLDRDRPNKVEKIDEMISSALWANPAFRTAVIPLRIKTPMYAKYTEGMNYGVHSDNPIMGGPEVMRSDLSVTLFLAEPDTYEGGELTVRTDNGEARIKLPKGDAVVYPTGALHAVQPVTKGERVVAVTWIQSVIADPHRRKIAGEIDLICQSLSKKLPQSDELNLLTAAYGNLVRLWGKV